MITVPPSSIRRSAIRPITGLQVRPEVVSEPPHSTPTVSADTGQGRRRIDEARVASRSASRVPSAIAWMVPPGCSVTDSTGLPLGRIRRATSSVV